MQNIVVIKGSEQGLEIVLNEKESYAVLREELIKKLIQNKNFFKDSDTKVVIRGKALSDAQRNEIKRIFDMDYGIRDVLYGDEADLLMEISRERENIMQAIIAEKEKALEAEEKTARMSDKDLDTSSATYYDVDSLVLDRTVRNGERIECEGDVSVIGDVNPGAEIIAAGNIVVFGRLLGLAHAGCRGNTDVRVAAVYLSPKQLRVSGKIKTFPKEGRKPDGPEVARLKNGEIIISAIRV